MAEVKDFNKGFVCVAVYLHGNLLQKEYYQKLAKDQLITVENPLEALILDEMLKSWFQSLIEDLQKNYPQHTYAIEKIEE